MGKVLKGRAAGQNHAKFPIKSSAAQSVLTALERHIEKHDDIEYRTKQVQRPWTHLSPVRWRITLRFADRDVVGSLWDARSRWYLRPWWVQQAGKTDGDQILKHEKLLIEIRSIIGDHGNIQEPCLIDIIAKLAKKRESTWHLAKEGPAWTKSLAQMLRAMLKDISLEVKRVNKGQRGASGGPKWIRPFLSSSSTAEECDEADEVEPEEEPEEGEEEEAQEADDEVDVEEAEEEEEEEEEKPRPKAKARSSAVSAGSGATTGRTANKGDKQNARSGDGGSLAAPASKRAKTVLLPRWDEELKARGSTQANERNQSAGARGRGESSVLANGRRR